MMVVMGIFSDSSIVCGVRILKKDKVGDYHLFRIVDEPTWKYVGNQKRLFWYYERADFQVQVAHPTSTTHNGGDYSFPMWTTYEKLEDLQKVLNQK